MQVPSHQKHSFCPVLDQAMPVPGPKPQHRIVMRPGLSGFQEPDSPEKRAGCAAARPAGASGRLPFRDGQELGRH